MVAKSSDDAAATRGGSDCRPEGLDIFNMCRVDLGQELQSARSSSTVADEATVFMKPQANMKPKYAATGGSSGSAQRVCSTTHQREVRQGGERSPKKKGIV